MKYPQPVRCIHSSLIIPNNKDKLELEAICLFRNNLRNLFHCNLAYLKNSYFCYYIHYNQNNVIHCRFKHLLMKLLCSNWSINQNYLKSCFVICCHLCMNFSAYDKKNDYIQIQPAQSDEEDVNRKYCLFKILSKSTSTMSMECKSCHQKMFSSGAL